jgi:predicted outer membrane protein
MKHTRTMVLGALLIAASASAQERMAGSGLRITKDGGEVSTTPSTTTTVVTVTPLNLRTAFDISSYGALNEKQIAYLFAAGDSAEIEMGHLAHTKGTAQSVRDYGMMLANDHTAHLAKTMEIITDEDVGSEPIPNNNEGARMKEMLSWLRNNAASANWDANFLRFQAQHHQNVIDILNLNIKNAHDDDMEDHIEKSLTSLAKHRDAAKTAASGLGVTIP